MAMEQDDSMVVEKQSNTGSTIAGLPNEIWAMFFCSIYFDKDALNDCKDIFEALNYLKTDFKEKLSLYSKNISGACKAFDCINKNLQSIQKLKEFYRLLLSEKFLEFRDGGFYPKDGTWGIRDDVDKRIAEFLATGNEGDHCLVADVVGFTWRDGLHTKVSNLIEKVIALLLFYNADISHEKGYEILYTAILHHHCEGNNMCKIIELLLANGVDVNSKGKNYRTALCFAVSAHSDSESQDKREIIKLLLTHGANVNIQTDPRILEGLVSRHNTKYHGDMSEIVEMLLAHGGDVNTKDKYGRTILHQAVNSLDFGHDTKDMIEILLAHGADVNIKDKWGYTAVDDAKGDVKELLKNSESYLNRQQSCLLS